MKKLMMLLLFMTVMSQAMEKSKRYFVLVELPSELILRQYLLESKTENFFKWLAKENEKRQQGNIVGVLELCFRDYIRGYLSKEREIAKQRSADIIALLKNYPEENEKFEVGILQEKIKQNRRRATL